MFPARLRLALTWLAIENRQRYNQSVPDPEKPAPSIRVRLAWWFTIYLSALVPFVRYACSEYPPFNLFTIVIFPVPLGFVLAPLVNLFQYETVGKFLAAPLFIAGPAFYLLHLRATLKARTLRRFDWLLLMLVIVVLGNQAIVAQMATAIRH